MAQTKPVRYRFMAALFTRNVLNGQRGEDLVRTSSADMADGAPLEIRDW